MELGKKRPIFQVVQSVMLDRQELSSVVPADVLNKIQLFGAGADGELYREKLFGLVQMEMSDEKNYWN
jgi:hypothetical protein